MKKYCENCKYAEDYGIYAHMVSYECTHEKVNGYNGVFAKDMLRIVDEGGTMAQVGAEFGCVHWERKDD